MTSPNPQAQPPLQDGDTPENLTQPPLYSLAQRVSIATASAPNNDNNLPAPPTRSSLASGNSVLSVDNNSESLTNFMKYGTIRPPVTVLQEEFLEKYRSWKEYAEPLDGIDGMTRGWSVGDVLMRHMACVQTMYTRHHGLSQFQCQQYEGERDLLDPRPSLWENSEAVCECTEAVCEQKCEDEEKIAADDDGDDDEEKLDCTVSNTSLTGNGERKQLENLAAILFRPGSKFSGSDYELVVMEGDAMDEMGQPKGILARHKLAGDEQCIFVKLSFVPVENTQEEEKESIEDEGKSQEYDTTGDDEGSDVDNGSIAISEKKLTIQIDYVDGDNLIHGLWNRDTLCFEGTVKKLSEGQGDQHQIRGTIISGLISGHSSFNGGNEESRSGEGNRLGRTAPSDGTGTFSMSPCTHLHPRGVTPTPLRTALSENLSLLLHTTQSDIARRSIVTSQDPTNTTSPKESKRKSLKPENKKELLYEIASHDNYKLVLHRSQTETLRRETLTKLVELGSVIDFAELARKRNVAKRREKWRGRVRKYTPRLPRRPLRRGRTSTTGGEDYDLSKDNVQKKKVQFHDQLAVISWGDLLEEASIQAERTCAIFRRETALLDNLTFESDEYKAQLMSDLRTNGLTLAGSHSEWDQCIQMGRTVALGWSWFERGSWSCFERSAVVGKRCVHLLFLMHSRLETNHKQLEMAYRGADARLTNMQLEKIKQVSHARSKHKTKDGEGAEDESGDLCGVCQCGMDDEGESGNEDNPAICLPCSHSFHWECIREWLHNHSQCPICRVDLNVS